MSVEMVRHLEGRPQFGAFGAQHSLGWNAASRMYGDENVQSRSRLTHPQKLYQRTIDVADHTQYGSPPFSSLLSKGAG